MAMALALLEVGALFAALTLVLAGTPGLAGQAPWTQGPGQALALAVSCGVTLYLFGLYDLRRVQSWASLAPRLAICLTAALVFGAGAVALLPSGASPTPSVYAILLAFSALALPVRALIFALLKRPGFSRRVLLIGHGPLAERVRLEIDQSRGYTIVGVLAASAPPVPVNGNGDGGRLATALRSSMAELEPDVVVVALPERRGQLPTDVLLGARLGGTRIAEGTEFYEDIAQKMAIENLTPSNLIFCPELTKPRVRTAVHRALSLCVAVVGIVLTAPLMAAIAVLVKLGSDGPVFFVQQRVGLGGRVFPLLKFRTMRGQPKETDGVWRRDDQARITRFGRFLRRTRLDELPQFFNILQGDMNLVGPRPEMARNVAEMNERIPYYPVRHTVRPGVTGWAQIKQGYAVTYDEVLEKTCYDLYYIKNMSLGLDLRILSETVKTVVLRGGT